MRAAAAIRRIVLVGVLAAVVPGTAHAWHESGHRIVARIAWDEMTAEQQRFVSDTLARHPRFTEDFFNRMPEGIKRRGEDDAERRRWIFMHASIWPDLIKEEVKGLIKQVAAAEGAGKAELERRLAEAKKYDNPTWHYDNEPIYLDPYALVPAAPVTAGRPMGVQLALPMMIKELGDRAVAVERRAVALAWVVHLLGDSHQPLHAATIFTAGLLPQGDAGGNRVSVTVPEERGVTTNLHAVWDGLFNSKDERAELLQKKRVVAAYPRRSVLAEVTAGGTVEARVDLWLDESFRAADASVYDAKIRGALLASVGAQTTVLLDLRYLQAAKKVAMRRVALAGYRLAEIVGAAAGG